MLIENLVEAVGAPGGSPPALPAGGLRSWDSLGGQLSWGSDGQWRWAGGGAEEGFAGQGATPSTGPGW